MPLSRVALPLALKRWAVGVLVVVVGAPLLVVGAAGQRVLPVPWLVLVPVLVQAGAPMETALALALRLPWVSAVVRPRLPLALRCRYPAVLVAPVWPGVPAPRVCLRRFVSHWQQPGPPAFWLPPRHASVPSATHPLCLPVPLSVTLPAGGLQAQAAAGHRAPAVAGHRAPAAGP